MAETSFSKSLKNVQKMGLCKGYPPPLCTLLRRGDKKRTEGKKHVQFLDITDFMYIFIF